MKITEYRWLTAGYNIEEGEGQKVSPEGLPVFKPDGTPELEKITVLVLIRQTEHEQEILRIPFSDNIRKKLASDLMGGIVVARPGDMRGML